MAEYFFSEVAIYTGDPETLLFAGPASASLAEDPTPDGPSPVGSVNGVFEVGEEILSAEGEDAGSTYIGTGLIDGITVVVTANPDGAIRFFVPASVPPGTISWPTNLMDIPLDAIDTVICLAKSTLISTPKGHRKIETLSIGDEVMTENGSIVSVKWIGRQTIPTVFCLAARVRLVRVRAGALGDGLPERDLVLTADHALMVEGLLVNAGALVNGSSIENVPVSELGDSCTVYHIETENHDIILAEGAPVETYIDYAGRQAFDNYAEYVALYGADRPIAENPAPRISSARMLPAALCARLGVRRAA